MSKVEMVDAWTQTTPRKDEKKDEEEKKEEEPVAKKVDCTITLEKRENL